jgi:hypothetical protein
MTGRLAGRAEVISRRGDNCRLRNRDLGRIPATSHHHGDNP